MVREPPLPSVTVVVVWKFDPEAAPPPPPWMTAGAPGAGVAGADGVAVGLAVGLGVAVALGDAVALGVDEGGFVGVGEGVAGAVTVTEPGEKLAVM